MFVFVNYFIYLHNHRLNIMVKIDLITTKSCDLKVENKTYQDGVAEREITAGHRTCPVKLASCPVNLMLKNILAGHCPPMP